MYLIFCKVWKYQSGNQNPFLERHTIQWPKEGQNDKQQPTKHYAEN